METVLVTGATGFVGSRLVRALQGEGVRVRVLIRRDAELPAGVESVRGDLLSPLTLPAAMEGVDVAYYLVHSMGGGKSGFKERDRMAAVNFRDAAGRAGVRRVVYLGGLGEMGDDLSEHLRSRREVAEILQEGAYETTVLRAAVIIGAGGASFEMIRSLVTKLPLMITPRWVSTRCQPIAIGDVIHYLVGVGRIADAVGTFDIGGPDILSYREMMEIMAQLLRRPLFIIPVPLLTPRLSSYWVGLFTPVRPSISMPLIEGLANEVICRDGRIRELVPFRLTPYREAVRIALAEEGESG